jgi:hypothetical protein
MRPHNHRPCSSPKVLLALRVEALAADVAAFCEDDTPAPGRRHNDISGTECDLVLDIDDRVFR